MTSRFRARAAALALLLLAAVVPLVGLRFLAGWGDAERASAESARKLDLAVRTTVQRVDARTAEDTRAVTRLCERDLVVDRLLLDVAAGRFDDPSRRAELASVAPSLMRSAGLDALDIIDERAGREGVVLASGRDPGRVGRRDERLRAAAARAEERPFAGAWLGDGRRAVLVSCVVRRDAASLRFVGGRALDEAYLRGISPGTDDVSLWLGDANAEEASGETSRIVHVFRDERGAPTTTLSAVLEPHVDETPWGGVAFGTAVAGAIVLALVLALLMPAPARSSGQLASDADRSLAELEEAIGRVASGDLDVRVAPPADPELRRVVDAFHDMTREVKAAQSRLLRVERRNERLAAWRDIARRIAHEVKNPLSPIQVSIETMQKTFKKSHPDFPEIFEDSTRIILEEVERLRQLVTEFSDFARMAKPSPEVLDFPEHVAKIVALHQGGKATVELVLRESVPKIRADRDQLTQVIENLVKNAAEAALAKHGGARGRVRVTIEPTDGAHHVRMRVEDDGPGVPESERQHVFEPYYTTKAGGSGLGLAIVHRIVVDHGGTLEVSESDLGGAELVIELPDTGPPLDATASITVTPLPEPRRGI